jgi:hypothetical protein
MTIPRSLLVALAVAAFGPAPASGGSALRVGGALAMEALDSRPSGGATASLLLPSETRPFTLAFNVNGYSQEYVSQANASIDLLMDARVAYGGGGVGITRFSAPSVKSLQTVGPRFSRHIALVVGVRLIRVGPVSAFLEHRRLHGFGGGDERVLALVDPLGRPTGRTATVEYPNHDLLVLGGLEIELGAR